MSALSGSLQERTIDLRDSVASTPGHEIGADSPTLCGLNLSSAQEERKEAIMTLALAHPCVTAVVERFMEIGDTFTAAHQMRVGELLAAEGVHQEDDPREVLARTIAGLVHDVGKCLMQEAVHSTGPLTPAGRETIKWHTRVGALLLERCRMDGNIVQMVGNHHAHQRHNACHVYAEIVPVEDESGHTPDTVHGAQLLSIADFYDALRSPRPYRPTSLGVDETLAIMGSELTVEDHLMDRFAGLVTPQGKQAA